MKMRYFLQNWSSDGHFEALNKSESWLVQQLWHKTQKNPKTQKKQMHFFLPYCKKPEMEIFVFWVITFESIKVYTC